MESEKSVEPTLNSHRLEESIKWRSFGWWIRQIFVGIREPRGVVGMVLALIGVPCTILTYTYGCPIHLPVLGLLAGFIAARQEKERIFSREEGGVAGAVSALILAILQVIVIIFIWVFVLAIVGTGSTLPLDLNLDLSTSQLLILGTLGTAFVVLINVVIVVITGIVGYYGGYWSVTPEILMEHTEKFEVFQKEAEESGGVFISYAHEDKGVVQRLVEHFKKDKIPYWIDTDRILVGKVIRKEIEEGIKRNLMFLVVLSPSYLKSRWVDNELDQALLEVIEGKKVMLPILVKKMKKEDIPQSIRPTKYTDLSVNFEAGYQQLREAISTYMEEYKKKK